MGRLKYALAPGGLLNTPKLCPVWCKPDGLAILEQFRIVLSVALFTRLVL